MIMFIRTYFGAVDIKKGINILELHHLVDPIIDKKWGIVRKLLKSCAEFKKMNIVLSFYSVFSSHLFL